MDLEIIWQQIVPTKKNRFVRLTIQEVNLFKK